MPLSQRVVISTQAESALHDRVMSKESDDSNREKPALVRAEGGRFTAGTAAGPGRPKRGVPLSEQWRRAVDWERMRTELETIATSAKVKASDRIMAIRELLDRSWGRPLTSHELHVTQGPVDESRNLAHPSEQRLRELLAEIDGEQPALEACEQETQ